MPLTPTATPAHSSVVPIPPTACSGQMPKWQLSGYVPDSDGEDDEVEEEETLPTVSDHSISNHHNQPHNAHEHSTPRPTFPPDLGFPQLFSDLQDDSPLSSPFTLTPQPASPAHDRPPSPSDLAITASIGPTAPREGRTPSVRRSSSTSSNSSSEELPSLRTLFLQRDQRHVSPIVRIPVQAPTAVQTAVQTAMDNGTSNDVSTLLSPDFESTQNVFGRALRPRKPIQLHPFLVEDALYRHEWREHGLKPIRTVVPVPAQAATQAIESQEQEFDPDESSDSGLDNAGPSSPVILAPRSGAERTRRPTPLGSKRANQKASHIQYGSKRRKLAHNGAPLPAPSAQPRRTGKLITDNHANRNLLDIDIYDVPSSESSTSSPPRPRGRGSFSSIRGPPAVTASDPHTPITPADVGHADNPDEESPLESSPVRPVRRGLQRQSHERSPERDSDSSPDERDPAEVVVRQAKRRIKGVLPASWLRLDMQAQSKKQTTRQSVSATPEPSAVPRGVAQRVTRRRTPMTDDRLGQSSAIVISDDSGSRSPSPLQEKRQDSYPILVDSDDDLRSMEHDTLPLFPLGGSRSRTVKKKRQLKVTEKFVRSGNNSTSKSTRAPASSHLAPSHTIDGINRSVSGNSKRLSKTTPRLSIIDSRHTVSTVNQSVPQFIKVAMRLARKQPQQGRHSPRRKTIRLHTSADTNEANKPLQDWRDGILQPTKRPTTGPAVDRRKPLAQYADNGQRKAPSMVSRAASDRGRTEDRSRSKANRGAVVIKEVRRTSIARKPTTYRTGQLEGLESDFHANHRRLAFEKGLSRVDQQFALQSFANRSLRNPQLAKFLEDEDASPLPAALPPNETTAADEVPKRAVSARRLIRKRKARRIDAEAREYRQPSETAFHGKVPGEVLSPVQTVGNNILHGLGPFDTRYPTTFDVCPLELGTYFSRTTFIGSGSFQGCLALSQRELDVQSGCCYVQFRKEKERCGPWNDVVCTRISGWARTIALELEADERMEDPAHSRQRARTALLTLSEFIRSLNVYISTALSFLDPPDRNGFTARLTEVAKTLRESAQKAHVTITSSGTDACTSNEILRVMSYLLVLAVQVSQIARSDVVEPATRSEWQTIMRSILRETITHVLQKGMPELHTFLDENKLHQKRENGIGEEKVVVETVVICMHVCRCEPAAVEPFWSIVDEELRPRVNEATHTAVFESVWSQVFTLLPFSELNSQGLLDIGRRFRLQADGWSLVRTILNRVFFLYPASANTQNSSINSYVRATLARCHRLISFWGWRKCDSVLGATFDFFARTKLKLLQHEPSRGSPRFLEALSTTPSLELEPDDTAFHIFLKNLAQGLQNMSNLIPEKRFRSMVWRLIPNHGRLYPKEEDLCQEDLDALRNHHDILTVLYWASPPTARPKVDLLQGLVQHSSSHREACNLNVRAWKNLAMFQVASEEPSSSAKPFALWYKAIVHQTLEQYRLARTEAEAQARAMQGGGPATIPDHMLQQMIRRNQAKVIGTLIDSIVGLSDVVNNSKNRELVKEFLVNSDVLQLFELDAVNDIQLRPVIQEALTLANRFATLPDPLSESTTTHESEESQDFGEWPDSDDLVDLINLAAPAETPKADSGHLGFILSPLWRLLSNVFGAEHPPNDDFLTKCVDTWVHVAKASVAMKERSWEDLLGSHGTMSWEQLRETEQTRKFGVYFMASVIEQDPKAYNSDTDDFFSAWLLSLLERESMLKFQHRLTNAIVNGQPGHPLLANLPFILDPRTGTINVTADVLSVRRLALVSSVLANMRDVVHAAWRDTPERAAGIQAQYATLLKKCMSTMKKHFLELQPGNIAGAYVEFVQTIVQFLNQYTIEICPVDRFFTDSTCFPLPTHDPEYVVGRLRGFATKLAERKSLKELSVFVQKITQQAARENQQRYLVTQLTSALSGSFSVAVAIERVPLRTSLFENVFPAYIDMAFRSSVGLAIAEPVFESLKSILPAMSLDLNATSADSVRSCVRSLLALLHTIVQNVETVTGERRFLTSPSQLRALSGSLELATGALPLLGYIHDRTSAATSAPFFVKFFKELCIFLAAVLSEQEPDHVPVFEAHPSSSVASNVLRTATRELEQVIRSDWSERDGMIRCKGNRREIILNVSSVEEERAHLATAVGNLYPVCVKDRWDSVTENMKLYREWAAFV